MFTKRKLLVFVILAILVVAGALLYLNVGGTMTDPRDGKTYRTVKIGDQVWMAENLNYNVSGAKNSCYENKPENCQKYGRLYTWDAAKDACPDGWILPTVKDWSILINTVGGQANAAKKLKAKQGWENSGNGTDEFSFAALPAGNLNWADGQYYNENGVAFFWSSTETGWGTVFQMFLRASDDNAWLESRFGKGHEYSVRCLKSKTRPTVEKASATDIMTDPRDGKTYRTVKIGDLEWMAENLRFDYNIGSAKTYCYGGYSENCEKYGGLYTWSAVMDSAALFSIAGQDCGSYNKDCWPNPPVQGACPYGWHIPTHAEMAVLFMDAYEADDGYDALFSTTEWNNGHGSDAFSFSARPAGYWSSKNMSFSQKGDIVYFWTSDSYNGWDSDSTEAVYFHLKSQGDTPVESLKKSDGLSVRCVKDLDNNKNNIGALKDMRDGKFYKTVKIGEQTWMAENLNYETGDSYCYENKPENCVSYGRLYTWESTVGICPEGWHVPAIADWQTLYKTAGGKNKAAKALKSNKWWYEGCNGTDDYGFAALPVWFAGKYTDSLFFDNEFGSHAYFWSSTEHSENNAYVMDFSYSDVAVLIDVYKSHAFPVRCVKD